MDKDVIAGIITGLGTLSLAGITGLVHRYKKPKNKLYKHYLFNELKAWVSESYNLKFINKYKTKVGRDLWRIKLEVGYKHLFNWAMSIDSGNEDLASIYNIIGTIVSEYNMKWQNEGLPETVIKKFNKYHDENIRTLKVLIELELNYKHKTIKEQACEILNYFRAVYIIAKGDVQAVINQANGTLKDKEYKGIKNTNEFIK